MGMDISKRLMYYKRLDIRQAMYRSAADKEVAIRYDDKGYGRRPDIIETPGDILEFVKRGATSFHASEERWTNPMLLQTGISKKDMAEIRKGWDLVLDIDCPYWELAKLTAKLMLHALKDNGIKNSVSIKFSGNKGFHIGVPFESFPKFISVKGETLPIETLFPDAARKVALYIVDYISDNYIRVEGSTVYFADKSYTLHELKNITGKDFSDLTIKICSHCSKRIKQIQDIQKIKYLCEKCGHYKSIEEDERYIGCDKCQNPFMERVEEKKSICSCGSNQSRLKFNPLSIVEVDTILISSRHLYRMEFSLHEKSGLASVPFNPDKIDIFEKEHADTKKAKVSKFKFLDRDNAVENEALNLFLKAYDHNPDIEEDEGIKKHFEVPKEFEVPLEAISEDLFPPCIKKGLLGMQDGKKRFMFALTNFLMAAGWSHDMITVRLIGWNKVNPEPLREQYLTGHLRYNKQHTAVNAVRTIAPPPNCLNTMYYKDLGICFRDTDNLCQKIKNPLQYSKRLIWAQNNQKKKGRKKKKD